jgi:hypothetical protein
MKPPKLKPPNLTVCHITFSPIYHPTHATHLVINDKRNNFHLPTLARYASRPKVGLWWNVTSNTMAGKKVVVRRWSARRLRNAIVEALEERGFDGEGKRLVGGNLTGTLQVRALQGIVQAKFEAVKKEAGCLVEHVMEVCREEAESKGSYRGERGRWWSQGKLEIGGDNARPLNRKTAAVPPRSSSNGETLQKVKHLGDIIRLNRLQRLGKEVNSGKQQSGMIETEQDCGQVIVPNTIGYFFIKPKKNHQRMD